MGKTLYRSPEYKIGDSVYRGETWNAFRPGEDERFNDAWVSRRGRGELCACVNTRKDLVNNAKMLGVKLKWKRTK